MIEREAVRIAGSVSTTILALLVVPFIPLFPGQFNSCYGSVVSLFPSEYWNITWGERVTLEEAYQSTPFLLLIPSRTPSGTHLIDVRITRNPWGSVDLAMLIYNESGSSDEDSLEDLMASGGMAIITGQQSLPQHELDSILESLVLGKHSFGEVKVIHDVPVILADGGWKLEGVIYRQDTIIDVLLSPRYSLEDLEMVAFSIIEQIHGARSSRFHYLFQDYECTLHDSAGNASVTHALGLFCSEGPISTVSLSLPYGDQEIFEMGGINNEKSVPVSAFTVDNEPILRKVEQTRNQTIVTMTLPQTLGTGENFTVVLKYWIRDLPGDLGIS